MNAWQYLGCCCRCFPCCGDGRTLPGDGADVPLRSTPDSTVNAASGSAANGSQTVVDGGLSQTSPDAAAAPAIISAGSGLQNIGTVVHDPLRGAGDQPDTADTGMGNSSRVSGTSNPGVGENMGNSSRNCEAQGSLSNNESGADEVAESPEADTPLLQHAVLDEAGANQAAASEPEG